MGIEPNCVLALRDELPDLVRGTACDELVVAPGFSCRHQIAGFCDHRRSLNTADLLAMARPN